MSTIIVCGSIAQRPGCPGHAWAFLSFLLGFRKLGYEVLFVDRLDSACVGAVHSPASVEGSVQGRWLAATMSMAGLEGRWAALLDQQRTVGLSRERLRSEIERCSLLFNVNGFLDDEELMDAAPRRVYLDIDPGFAQIWEAQGLSHCLDGHDDFVTVGTRVGACDCGVPTGGRRWVTTLPPVLLDLWRPAAARGTALTSVGSWRGPFAPLQHEGVTYGLRAHEFRRFMALPGRVQAPCMVALDIDAADEADREALEAHSWILVDPLRQLASFPAYQRYLQASMAEFSVAKGVYVGTRGGWFSDRSACYLACGKPVVAQATGVEHALPTGCGLLCFENLDEAAHAAQEVRRDLARHSAAARAIAEEHLDSDVVLGALLDRLGV